LVSFVIARWRDTQGVGGVENTILVSFVIARWRDTQGVGGVENTIIINMMTLCFFFWSVYLLSSRIISGIELFYLYHTAGFDG